ncbi:hypothetical protein CDAR_114731 [Caerostris darwini]|uniref:Uncharacterized protein n=1 Tax=Caerostris darwini TaxID=1538125 RepID=A0AAV4ME29_9ARAC|nr:hypothetical protein CDAR_114731 [Caerostris darwini]
MEAASFCAPTAPPICPSRSGEDPELLPTLSTPYSSSHSSAEDDGHKFFLPDHRVCLSSEVKRAAAAEARSNRTIIKAESRVRKKNFSTRGLVRFIFPQKPCCVEPTPSSCFLLSSVSKGYGGLKLICSRV